MKSLATLLLSAVLATGAFAGSPANDYSKSSKAVQPMAAPTGCDCFAPGFALGIFGGGMFPRHGSDNVAGGGLLAEYFFTENFGFQTSYGLYATSSEHHQIDGSFVLRFPIKSCCIAPYILAGGGVGTNSTTRGDYHAGGGFEARFASMKCMGIFVDGAYHFASGNGGDFAIGRTGLKFMF